MSANAQRLAKLQEKPDKQLRILSTVELEAEVKAKQAKADAKREASLSLRNLSGSSSGANSGDFYVARRHMVAEKRRLEAVDAEAAKEEEMKEHERRRAELMEADVKETAKKADKRKRRKKNAAKNDKQVEQLEQVEHGENNEDNDASKETSKEAASTIVDDGNVDTPVENSREGTESTKRPEPATVPLSAPEPTPQLVVYDNDDDF
ncbi:hypothetical protein GQ42DRAFT_30125 [Ramicandelaber brevisporus]|nr:hypothetical protein GQ42DRAFT_30125 [Ramicandelaber brevisporus]